ncbi:hypothetical protein DFH27DRAFT_598117 [Peziza echinospora]|nr:hypothetical protein DFH27DRAFT_598117 [Peziza echinospora]
MSPRKPSTRRHYSPTRGLGGMQTRIPVPILKGKQKQFTSTKKVPAQPIPRRASPAKRRAVVVPTLASTRALRSSTARGGASGQDKENFPTGGRGVVGGRGNGRELNRPKGKDGVQKKAFGGKGVGGVLQARSRRQPLRELTEAEVFERDEAVIGDLRRRRVSGENHIVDAQAGSMVEIDTVWAHEPIHHDENAAADGEDADDDAMGGGDHHQNQQVDPETPVPAPRPIERFQVLRRSDSEERLRSTLEAIVLKAPTTAAAAAGRPRTRAALATKRMSHPATRTSTGSMYSLDGGSIILHSAEASPAMLGVPSPKKHYAGVSKLQASPSPLKGMMGMGGGVGVGGNARVGLGAKSVNTALVVKRVLGEAKNGNGNGNGSGKISVLKEKAGGAGAMLEKAEKPVGGTKKRGALMAKEGPAAGGNAMGTKAKSSSLKRAAGGMGGGMGTARAGLAGIGRMR